MLSASDNARSSDLTDGRRPGNVWHSDDTGSFDMTSGVRGLLHSFESQPDADRRDLPAEIIRRTLRLEFPPLTDEDVVRYADELFLELDWGEQRI